MDNAWLKWCSKCPPPDCTQADKRRRHWRIAAVTTAWSRLDHSTHHCRVSKKNISLPTCTLGPLRSSMQKIRKSDAKLSEIYEQNLFSGQCNLRFLSTKVLQRNVATCVNYGMIFIAFFTANLLQGVTVKEFWKSVSISHSYRQNKVAPFFRTRCIYWGPFVFIRK